MHWHFRHRRVRGEWFKITAREAWGKLRTARVPKVRTQAEASAHIAALFDAQAEKLDL